MKKYFIFLIATFFGFSNIVFAIPIISSFVATPVSIPSGGLISLTWSGQDVGGYNLIVTCAVGVKIKNQDGSIFPCDIKNSITTSSGFIVINTSGYNKSISFRLYPKSSAGDEYPLGMKEQNVLVSPAPYPVNSLYASATSTTSGNQTTLYWTGISDLDGVNVMIPCIDGLSATSSFDGNKIYCGRIAFANKLPSTGSLSISFKNTNLERVLIKVSILPYIGDSLYDLSHAQNIDLDIAVDKILPIQILSFVSSKPSVASDDTVSLLWTSKNASGVNLKMDCVESLSASFVFSTTTQSVRCNKFFSDTALGPNASTSLVLYNTSQQVKNVTFTLFPQLTPDSFDGINTKILSISVSPKGQAVVFTPPPVQSVSTSTGATKPFGEKMIVFPRKKFTRSLSLGSRGDDVSALQEFLYKNGYSSFATTTGYFGTATQKAVQKFQDEYKIVKKGSGGYGSVGPITRTKLNSF